MTVFVLLELLVCSLLLMMGVTICGYIQLSIIVRQEFYFRTNTEGQVAVFDDRSENFEARAQIHWTRVLASRIWIKTPTDEIFVAKEIYHVIGVWQEG